MDKMRVEEELKQPNQEIQKAKQIQQQPPPPSTTAAGSATAASPASASSSPSHEFSFTISFNQNISTKTPENNKTKQNTPPSSFAIDLTPADDIFFRGHLLPLHLLSHLPVSPRSSTNSIDTSLPIKDSLEEKKIQKAKNQKELLEHDDDNSYYDLNHSFHYHPHQTNSFTTTKNEKQKSKSFSLFGLPKRKKEEKLEDKEKQRKLKFDVSQILKRYMRMVRPFLSFRSRKNMELHRQSYSYSGNLSFRSGKNKEIKGIKRGAYSAPVSMKTSPTNSGLLVATPGASYHNSSSSDSTMEELQAAIQAAIAHCKNSSSVEQKIKCHEND